MTFCASPTAGALLPRAAVHTEGCFEPFVALDYDLLGLGESSSYMTGNTM
jgi:hypothetical protein